MYCQALHARTYTYVYVRAYMYALCTHTHTHFLQETRQTLHAAVNTSKKSSEAQLVRERGTIGGWRGKDEREEGRRTLLTDSEACCSIARIHVWMLWNVESTVTSYTCSSQSVCSSGVFVPSWSPHQHNPHRAAIIRGGYGLESFLACCVPDLQLDPLAIELDGSDLEVNADCGDEGV